MNKILVATSIAPFAIDNQKKAVDSWLQAGFEVISCNAASEIAVIAEHFPKVRFVALERDATAILGKPYPYAYDVIQVLRHEGSDICGFINSDIHISGFSKGLSEEITKQAMERRFLYAHRLETKTLEEADMRKAESYRGGMDIFFFHKDILEIYPDEEYFIGNTIWDYWCLTIPFLRGIDLMEIRDPVFFHIKHDIRWQNLFDYFNRQIADKYFDSDMNACPRLMMSLVVHVRNNVCFIDKESAEKTVLVLVPEDAPLQTLASLKDQTHTRMEIRGGRTCSPADIAEYDYIFYARAGHIYINCAIDMLVQDAEAGQYDTITCLSSMVMQDDDESSPYFCRLLNPSPDITMERAKPRFNGRHRDLGLPLSNVSGQYASLKVIAAYKKLYIYAAGKMTDRLLRDCRRHNIHIDLLGICDKNSALWGQRLHGYEIFPPSKLRNTEEYDKVLIVSMYEEEIYEEIKSFVPAEKLFCLSRLL